MRSLTLHLAATMVVSFTLASGIAATAVVGCSRASTGFTDTARRATTTNTITAAGVVVTEMGEPMANALVSAWSHFDLETADPAYDTTSDSQGRFALALPPGRYALTATTTERAAAYSGVFTLSASSSPSSRMTLRVGAKGTGRIVAGSVRGPDGREVANPRAIAWRARSRR